MDLIESLATPPARGSTQCYTAKWILTRSLDEQHAIASALQNSQWNTTTLHKLFKDWGFTAQYSSVQRHRTHTCSCALTPFVEKSK